MPKPAGAGAKATGPHAKGPSHSSPGQRPGFMIEFLFRLKACFILSDDTAFPRQVVGRVSRKHNVSFDELPCDIQTDESPLSGLNG